MAVVVLFAVGLLGTVVPLLPGPVVIFAAALLHWCVVPKEKSVGWGVLLLLGLLMAACYAVDFGASYFGAKRFGATRRGSVGAIVGAVVGIFFGLPGIIVGPVVGVIAFELLRCGRLVAAGRAGWGTLLGYIAGVLLKLTIAVAMIALFLTRVPSPV